MDHTVKGVRFQLYERERKKRVSTLICYYVGSDRKQLTFQGNEEAAKKHCAKLAEKITSGDAAIHLSPLDHRVWVATKETAARIGRAPDVIVREHYEALKILDGKGTLLEAARLLRKHRATDLPEITLSALCDELVAHLTVKKREDITIVTLKSIHKPLREALGSCPLRAITTAELENYLGKWQAAGRTLNNHRSGIVRTWNYAKGRYLPKDEPTAADGLEAFTAENRGAVEIYRPWEFAALLGWLANRVRTATSVQAKARFGGLLRCELLGGFAGVRTIERCRAEGSAVRADAVSTEYPHGFVEIGLGIAKRHRTARRRIIAIQPNLAEWIAAFPFPAGPLSPYLNPTSLARAVTPRFYGAGQRPP